jgi:hypothetical protein
MVNCMIGAARGSGTNSEKAHVRLIDGYLDPGTELDRQIPRLIVAR